MLDYLLTNARIIDAESGSDFHGSLGIKDGKIDCLFKASDPLPVARDIIDADGGILTPGFIDTHAHSDNSIPCAEKLLAMGVTSAVSGNCGFGTTNFSRFFSKYEKTGYPVNQLEQIGHSILRLKAGIRDINAPASLREIEKMKRLTAEAFSEGACGLSFGLEYDPGASTEEITELSRVAAEEGRFVSIHSRYTGTNDMDSLREALDLAVITGVPLIYSHLVYMYTGEDLREAMPIIEEYRKKSEKIWVDSGMYTAFATIAGSPCFGEDIFLDNETEIMRLRAATGKYAGQYLNREKYLEIRASQHKESLIYDPGDMDDVFAAYSLPDVMVSTDCIEYPAGQGHPQGAATYPFFFRVMVKETGTFSLLEAVKRCTLLPAQAAGFTTKGRLSAGMDADLVVLDWQRLREHADFPDAGDPGSPPTGVKYVFVNGVLAVKDEKRLAGVNAGACIRR